MHTFSGTGSSLAVSSLPERLILWAARCQFRSIKAGTLHRPIDSLRFILFVDICLKPFGAVAGWVAAEGPFSGLYQQELLFHQSYDLARTELG